MLINLFIASAFVLLSIVALLNFERFATLSYKVLRTFFSTLVALLHIMRAMHCSFKEARRHFYKHSLTPAV